MRGGDDPGDGGAESTGGKDSPKIGRVRTVGLASRGD